MSLKLAQGGSPRSATCAVAGVWELHLEGWIRAASLFVEPGSKSRTKETHCRLFLLFGLFPTPLGAMTQEWKLLTDTAFLGPRKMKIHSMERTRLCSFPASYKGQFQCSWHSETPQGRKEALGMLSRHAGPAPSRRGGPQLFFESIVRVFRDMCGKYSRPAAPRQLPECSSRMAPNQVPVCRRFRPTCDMRRMPTA